MSAQAENDTAAMDAEFDTVARWTEAAVERLGVDHAVPAACRGSASPAALDWLAAVCRLDGGTRLVDVGGGMGGPAAVAARQYGAVPTVVESMLGACRAARNLFGLSVVAAAGERLPLASGSADAAWCLGVLCTTPNKQQLVAEIKRVLRPGAPLGLLVFVATSTADIDAPEGNTFPTMEELARILHTQGFEIEDQRDLDGFPAPPRSWQDRIERVEQELTAAHADDPLWTTARDQEQRIAALLAEGKIAGRLLIASATSSSARGT